jgi:hypothetical protein
MLGLVLESAIELASLVTFIAMVALWSFGLSFLA